MSLKKLHYYTSCSGCTGWSPAHLSTHMNSKTAYPWEVGGLSEVIVTPGHTQWHRQLLPWDRVESERENNRENVIARARQTQPSVS